MERVLVIGASGFLGETICYKLKENGIDVLGTYSRNKKHDDYVKLDVLDLEGLSSLIREYKPDTVIWTVMNHDLEVEIADKVMPVLCDLIGDSRLVFVSTSVAYEENMSEDVEPFLRPENMYNYKYFNGKIKSENEIKKLKNYCIVRPGSIYGINPYGEMDCRSRILKEYVNSGKEYVRADNIIFSIVEVNELAAAMIELASSDYVGIINVSEEKPISHYEFNKALCKRYGWDDSCVVPNKAEENIYYLNNALRKKIVKAQISGIR